MDTIPIWFEGVYINIAENLMYTRSEYDHPSTKSMRGKEDSKVAVTEIREGNTEIRNITWRQLRSEVAELASAMRAHGTTRGDRIAVVTSNSFDTLKVFLATSALGCIFSSSSTDMGIKGILDRLIQIEPKVREQHANHHTRS
jgi:acetoacetyl-CoA synthetase